MPDEALPRRLDEELLRRPDEELLMRPDEELLRRPGEELLRRPDEELLSRPDEEVLMRPDEELLRRGLKSIVCVVLCILVVIFGLSGSNWVLEDDSLTIAVLSNAWTCNFPPRICMQQKRMPPLVNIFMISVAEGGTHESPSCRQEMP